MSKHHGLQVQPAVHCSNTVLFSLVCTTACWGDSQQTGLSLLSPSCSIQRPFSERDSSTIQEVLLRVQTLTHQAIQSKKAPFRYCQSSLAVPLNSGGTKCLPHTFKLHLAHYNIESGAGSTSHLTSFALVIHATVVWPLSGSRGPSPRHGACLRCPPPSQPTPPLALLSKSRGLERWPT